MKTKTINLYTFEELNNCEMAFLNLQKYLLMHGGTRAELAKIFKDTAKIMLAIGVNSEICQNARVISRLNEERARLELTTPIIRNKNFSAREIEKARRFVSANITCKLFREHLLLDLKALALGGSLIELVYIMENLVQGTSAQLITDAVLSTLKGDSVWFDSNSELVELNGIELSK